MNLNYLGASCDIKPCTEEIQQQIYYYMIYICNRATNSLSSYSAL